jgi:hypothetical protein
MPVDTTIAMRTWNRYAYCRDAGHQLFVEKADKCESFFAGDQWDSLDLAKLKAQKRPALTINKIISTISNVMGEQIFNRSEIAYRPRSGSPAEIAECLTKVFKQISDNNQLDWKRSDMFADGAITSRGYLDIRIEHDDHMQGEVRIVKLNPKNVIVDPDAEDYDPDTWNEVFVTKWMTADQIAVLYNKEDAEILRNRSESSLPFGYDSISDRLRDRFGSTTTPMYGGIYDESGVTRNIRVIERQYRKLDNQEHFVSMQGDTRPVPPEFSREKKKWFMDTFGFAIIKKLVNRIHWDVVADNVVLHSEWSPYKHFTPVPYFPIFRHGRTIGLVENLLGSQELLNKSSSQELHVINTSANSGWKVRAGAVTNMTPEELEQRGGESGIVIEVQGDPEKDAVKITPNSTPQGLDRVSYKAEEHIKSISGVSDSMQGFDREDVAAKAIQAKRQAGSTNLAKPLDSLVRTDWMIARNILDLIQENYTEERILTITKDRITGETEEVPINQVNAAGMIINDLTLGEYSAVVSSVPVRETLEDSQFEQAISMREQGIPIPDEVIIDNSRLTNKKEIIAKMQAGANSPEAQQQRQLALRGQEAEVEKTKREGENKHADTQLKIAKATTEMNPEKDDGSGMAKVVAEAEIKRETMRLDHQFKYAELAEERRHNEVEEAIESEAAKEQALTDRAAAVAAAANPQPAAGVQK